MTNLTGWLTYRARRQEYKDCRAHPPLIYMMSRGENINNKELKVTMTFGRVGLHIKNGGLRVRHTPLIYKTWKYVIAP